LNHFFDGLSKTNQNGSRNNTVADVELAKSFNLGNRSYVPVGQTMTGMDNQSG
jgi:hypothetical protein